MVQQEWMGIEPDSATEDDYSVYVVAHKDATQLAVLHSLLLDKGFSLTQLSLINDAMHQAALET